RLACLVLSLSARFSFDDPVTTRIKTLSLHDALPICFFWLPGGVPVLLPCMMLTIVGQLGAWPVLQTFTSELFPTGLRSSAGSWRSEEHTSELQSRFDLVCRLLLEKKKSTSDRVRIGS